MVSTGYVPIIPNRVGAVEPYIYELSRNLSLNHSVDVFGTGKGEEKVGNMHVKAFGYRESLPHLLEAPLGYRLAFQVPFNIYLFKEFCDLNKYKHVDVLHIHDANSGFAATAIKKIFNTPSVCSVHNEIRSAASIRACDKVLAVSNYIRDFLVGKRGLSRSKVDVLNIAIDTNLCKRKRKIEKAKEALQLADRNIVLFVGRKCPEKGLQILVDALPKIVDSNPKTLVILVGPDHKFGVNSEGYTEFLKNRAKKLGVEKNAFFVSFVSQNTLELFYEAADLLVLPSIWQEPFGKVILEAMSYETPVIASAVGGVPEIVVNETNGLLVRPGDSGALARSVNHLLKNPEFARTLGAEGKKTVLKKYTFDQVVKRCCEIYDKIV
jgi:glycosyltransferase involved in cell wall biosynthesis